MEDNLVRSQLRGGLIRLFFVVAVVAAFLGVTAGSAFAGQISSESAFTIEKLQEIKGSGSGFTQSELSGKVGQTVDYKIVVKNTGKAALSLSEFTDVHCDAGTIAGGPGSKQLASGEATTYTCSHLLSEAGTYSNTASVTGTSKLMCGQGFSSMGTSNTVVVKVTAEPAAAIEKLQEIKGSGAGYTKAELTAQVGQTVDYKIIVRNTGDVPVKLSNFTDTHCENLAGGPGSSELAPNASTTYTCEHTLTAPGKWTNVASVTSTGNEHMCGKKTQTTLTSNTVVVNVPAEERLEIRKEQKFSTESAAAYTENKLTGKVGDVVDYKIIVTNDGNAALQLAKMTDANCTNIQGPGQAALQPGEGTDYTCEHTLTAPGIWTNEAAVETSTQLTAKSNRVEVEVPAEETFRVEKTQKLEGESSFTRAKLIASRGETVEYQIEVTNTGNAGISLKAIEDHNCSNIAGPGQATLQPGESTSYECEHVLTNVGTWTNEAEVETTSGKRQRSNKVEVEVPAQEGFKVEKAQKLAGEASFTTSKLTGKLNETVDYQITVRNTGNAALTLKAIDDPNCSNITGPGQATLQPGESTDYECEHVLTAVGTWTNEAEVETTTGKRQHTNIVEVEVPAQESFRVEKAQKLLGELSFTTSRLTGKLGELVDYQITVTNTGNTQLTLRAMTDPNCSNITGPGHAALEPGESTAYACEHLLTSVGTWTNEAEVESTTGKREHSNKVEVEVPGEEGFKVEKKQKLSGEPAYTTAKLVGKVGETVQYEIIVTNTGSTRITLKAMNDANCTHIQGPGKSELAPGEATTYTCEHVLTAGTWVNEATVETPAKSEKSNRVEVEAPAPKQAVKAECDLSESTIVLHGAGGARRKSFTVRIPALGIKEITFYVDGRKVKQLSSADAEKGEFSLTINPAKLSYGAHKISVKTVMDDSACAAVARAAVFVHPRPAKVLPKFTG